MFRTLIAAAGLAALAVTAHAGELADGFDGVVDQVNGFMGEEVQDIQATILDRGPIIDCGCPHLCAMLGTILRGEMDGQRIEQGLLIALQEDLSGGIVAGLRNGGKFDPALMEPAQIKAEYRDEMNVERLADMVGLAAKTVLK